MKYQVADYLIDTDRYRISRGSEVVPVEPKVFDLLLCLIQHRDRVLSRDELFEKVWAGREVSDATLSNHIKSARKALGDNGEQQHTIETVRGRGYQFIAAVSLPPEVTSLATTPAESTTPLTSPILALPATSAVPVTLFARAAGKWARWPLGIALLVLVGVSLTWYLQNSRVPAVEKAVPYIVVVPFDVAGETSKDWNPYADQVSREVIRNLRKISGLRVVPITSAFTFKDNKAREHIRRQLPEVQFVLDGEVSISVDNTLRITAELEDLRRGHVVWDQEFTTRTDDTNLFATQSNIAAAVSDSLRVAVLADEQRALDEFPTSNLKAYEAYVAGKHQFDLLSHESLPRAVRLFDQAIALDPQFFDAYIARSDVYRQLFGYFEPPINMLQNVVDSIAQAQALRPDSAEAFSSLGLTYVMAWRWRDAWTALNQAKHRDPSLAQTELGFALYYAAIGEAEKSKQALANAERLDPLNAEMADWGTWVLFMLGDHQAARTWVDKRMQQHPQIGPVFSGAGVAAAVAGDFPRAVQLAERGAELDHSALSMILLAQVYGYAGKSNQVLPLLAKATSMGSYACPYESAAAYLTINAPDRALLHLEEAVDKRSNCLIFLRIDPRMQSIRDLPQFRYLLTRVGLDNEAVRTYKR
jgi:DNA-binding winged helix-turn-helix (wHTH) protein/TolB-like protein/lipopolysaccharide biosynthesis regulator YciM